MFVSRDQSFLMFIQLAASITCPILGILDATSKIDCGFYGIQESQCVAQNCCWEPNPTVTAPWCYYIPTGSSTQNSVDSGITTNP
jgi:hypothetical protein